MLQQVNYFWRVIATGLCFTLFGLGGLLLSLFVLPVQRLAIRNEKSQKALARKTVHYSFKFFIAFMQFVGIFKFNLQQAQQLRSLNGHLVMANHPSLIDVVVLISMIPNADCVVKTHLFKNMFLKGVVSNTGYISNDDAAGLLDDCEASLKAGNNLIIFPQGTRTKPEENLRFQRGAANIAIRCQAKVTSVMLKVIPSTLTKNVPWYRIPKTKAHFSAMVVEHLPNLPENNVSQTSKDVRQYNRDLEDFFRKELSKYG
jgi:1-acyl-sn-glycerol-3-phosphate acyltransferase